MRLLYSLQCLQFLRLRSVGTARIWVERWASPRPFRFLPPIHSKFYSTTPRSLIRRLRPPYPTMSVATLVPTLKLKLSLPEKHVPFERIQACPPSELSQLPVELIYCLFEECEPSALISFALTSTSNLMMLTKWLDTTHALNGNHEEVHPGTRFSFLVEHLRRTKGPQGRREAASILRRWQHRALTEQGIMSSQEISQWNVCNGCLKFRTQHKTACTRCSGDTCEHFLCSIYCAL